MSGLRQSLLGTLLLLAACAQPGPPPGGPPDHTVPVLLSASPDTVSLPGFDDWVEFRFDEIVAEGGMNFGTGQGQLERLVLISPDTMLWARVEWGRDRIRVKPRNGWRPNTVYRIELAPGITDLRGNASKASHVVTFATGGPMPTRTITGRAVDWAQQSPLPGALIEAITVADSLVYRSVADSTGRFRFGPLPNTNLWIRASIDRNANHRLDYGEPWDTLRLAPDDSVAGEIWIFPRDTVPARHTQSAPRDSLAIQVQLDRLIDPTWSLPADSVEVWLMPDSLSVRPVSVMTKARYDSIIAAQKPQAPPPAAVPPPAPTTAPTGPQPDLLRGKRPLLSNTIVIELRSPLQAEKRYKILLRGVRTIQGVTGNVIGDFRTPKETPKPPPTAGTGGRGGRR